MASFFRVPYVQTKPFVGDIWRYYVPICQEQLWYYQQLGMGGILSTLIFSTTDWWFQHVSTVIYVLYRLCGNHRFSHLILCSIHFHTKDFKIFQLWSMVPDFGLKHIETTNWWIQTCFYVQLVGVLDWNRDVRVRKPAPFAKAWAEVFSVWCRNGTSTPLGPICVYKIILVLYYCIIYIHIYIYIEYSIIQTYVSRIDTQEHELLLLSGVVLGQHTLLIMPPNCRCRGSWPLLNWRV